MSIWITLTTSGKVLFIFSSQTLTLSFINIMLKNTQSLANKNASWPISIGEKIWVFLEEFNIVFRVQPFCGQLPVLAAWWGWWHIGSSSCLKKNQECSPSYGLRGTGFVLAEGLLDHLAQIQSYFSIPKRFVFPCFRTVIRTLPGKFWGLQSKYTWTMPEGGKWDLVHSISSWWV